jgi:DNA-directed RNA polymerase specialized sigma24 family protein
MSYLPEFKGPVEGYVVNFLHKNLWRVSRTHDFDDAMHEAYLVFLRTASKYPDLDTPQHFMALFKTSWMNEFHDLSTKATEARRLVTEALFGGEDSDGEEYRRDVIGDLDNDGSLAVMVRQAPKEVLLVLNLFLNAPQELLELAMTTWRKNGKYRADGDKAVAKMLGLPPDSTPVSDTQKYFG